MRLIKLTTTTDETRNGILWSEGQTHTAANADSQDGPELCSDTVLHAYRTVGQALLMNEMHGCFEWPHIWVAEGDIVVDDGSKVGCRTLTTVGQRGYPDWWQNDRQHSRVLHLTAILACGLIVDYREREQGDEPLPAVRAALAGLITAVVTGNALRAAWDALAACPPLYDDGLVHLSSLRVRFGSDALYEVGSILQRVSTYVLRADLWSRVPDDRQLVVGVIETAIAATTGLLADNPQATVKLLLTHPGVGAPS